MLPALLQNLSSHPLPSLLYLLVLCDHDDSDVRALTTFLPNCTNLRALSYGRDKYFVETSESSSESVEWEAVTESVEEEMWEVVVRSCRNLEVVSVSGKYGDVACDRLVSVLRKLSEREGIQALKLRNICGAEGDYIKQVKHLLPALQQ